MQIFTLGVGSWLRCLTSRNALVRASDRVEAAALLLVFVMALLAAPVAGAAGTALHDDLTHRFAAERAARQEIVATATEDSTMSPTGYQKPFLTPVRWTFAGTTHTEEVRTELMKAGEQLTIWIDTKGDRTFKPPSDNNAATAALVAGFGLWSTTVGIAAAAWTALRLRLIRTRYAEWDRALEDLAGNDGRKNHNA